MVKFDPHHVVFGEFIEDPPAAATILRKAFTPTEKLPTTPTQRHDARPILYFVDILQPAGGSDDKIRSQRAILANVLQCDPGMGEIDAHLGAVERAAVFSAAFSQAGSMIATTRCPRSKAICSISRPIFPYPISAMSAMLAPLIERHQAMNFS